VLVEEYFCKIIAMGESLNDTPDNQLVFQGPPDTSEVLPRTYWEIVTSLPYGTDIHYGIVKVPVDSRDNSFKMRDFRRVIFGDQQITDEVFSVFRDSTSNFPGIRKPPGVRKYFIDHIYDKDDSTPIY
jgi:hypothetical protein